MNGYGKKLRELRAGRSRREVAEALGMSVSALAMYELEQRIPRDEYKIKLAKYYRVSVESLFFSPKLSRIATSKD
jgi:transcriptional regulator with XRE-family HTH domain